VEQERLIVYIDGNHHLNELCKCINLWEMLFDRDKKVKEVAPPKLRIGINLDSVGTEFSRVLAIKE